MIENSTQNLPSEIIPRYKRLEELREIGKSVGFWNIPQGEMAKKYGVTRKTIYNDLQKIYKMGIDKDSVEKAVVHIDSLNSILCKGLLQDFLKAKTNTERARTAMALSQIQKDITDFLEKYGFKEKVADKAEIVGKSINLIINDTKDQYPDINLPPSKP